MKRVFAFIVFVFVVSITNAQWFWQNPLPQGNILNCVKFVDATTGFAVGDCGTILKTTNGGIDWIAQSPGTGDYLFSITTVRLLLKQNQLVRKFLSQLVQICSVKQLI
ncbi:MAG: hypothetical protein NTV01_20540 [Bacteroidia bacterium]|nr:hypothetical protein [Bacteroidia bacterium]